MVQRHNLLAILGVWLDLHLERAVVGLIVLASAVPRDLTARGDVHGCLPIGEPEQSWRAGV